MTADHPADSPNEHELADHALRRGTSSHPDAAALRQVADRLRAAAEVIDEPRIDPPAAMLPDIHRRIEGELPPRRRGLMVAAAILLVVIAASTIIVVGRDRDSAQLADFTELDLAGIEGGFRLVDETWGTQVEVRLTGLGAGTFDVWLRTDDDTRERIGGFAATEELITLASPLPAETLTDLWITDAGSERVAWADLRS